MSGRDDSNGAADSGRRLLQQAVDDGIRRAQGLNAKPSLRRYTWSRLHTDVLDDNRWPLVALRTGAPLPLVEALVMRLEIHANKSVPRGYVGDFNGEAMAARWSVDAAMVVRICEELERSDIGWIDQEQVVTFWSRNPDKVDETAAARQQRARDRKKGYKLLAAMCRQGAIDEALRSEREIALRSSKEPAELIASWNSSRRDAVTVTPRADQIIKQEGGGTAASVSQLGSSLNPIDPSVFAETSKALQWLRGDGEALVTSRLGILRSKASQAIQRWAITLRNDVTGLATLIHAALATEARGDAFRKLVDNQVARQATEMTAPALPFPPMSLKGHGR